MADEIRVPVPRAVVLAGFLVVTLLLSACGASKSAQHPGTVKVFFCTTASMPDCRRNATPSQEASVGRLLRRLPNVTKIEFISKAAALHRMHRLNPTLPVKSLPVNPLPDEWAVTVASAQDDATVGKAICAARYAGVQRCPPADLGGYGQVGGVVWSSGL
jgi:cell division protein FtsX